MQFRISFRKFSYFNLILIIVFLTNLRFLEELQAQDYSRIPSVLDDPVASVGFETLTSPPDSTVNKGGVQYVYRKMEKFDFGELVVEGVKQNPGDLSITPMKQKSYGNFLKYRENFNPELRRTQDRVR